MSVPTFDFSQVPSGSSGTATGSGPSLVLNRGYYFQTPDRPGVTNPNRPGKSEVVDVDTGAAHWFSLSDGERNDFAERAYRAGLIRDPNDYSQAQGAWEQAVQQAAGFYTYGNREVTPWEALDIMAGLAPGGGQQGGFTGTKTEVQKQVEIPTATTMRAALNSVLKDALGRAPSADEVDRYSAMFTKAAKENPVIARTTAEFKNGDRVSSTTTQSGGFSGTDMQQMALEKAQADPEYGAYQASTTYMNALMQAIGGTG